jgi:hypothetical protein
MHKSATKCNETIGKWCKNKHGASKIIDTFETYQWPVHEFEVEFLPSVVLPISEADVECYSTKWIVSTPWDYSMKGAICWLQELQ